LHIVVAALRQWGEAELYGPAERHSLLVDAQDNVPVETLILRAADGRSLGWTDTCVVKLPQTVSGG